MFMEVIGWTADLCFLGAYWLVSTKRVEGEGLVFNGMNLAGAFLYGSYAISKDATPVLVLEIFWGSIAIKALYALWKSPPMIKEQSSIMKEYDDFADHMPPYEGEGARNRS